MKQQKQKSQSKQVGAVKDYQDPMHAPKSLGATHSDLFSGAAQASAVAPGQAPNPSKGPMKGKC